mmetsp:Transcript_17615/g.53286  ORF Transcript_17615/g.53286 Transcript_17615/m.53286 type:complete len:373 (+) Transcript_17615:659-1777(+)|eukprot:scaffold290392_cov30-Tisochrysis_lutea.AAC.4
MQAGAAFKSRQPLCASLLSTEGALLGKVWLMLAVAAVSTDLAGCHLGSRGVVTRVPVSKALLTRATRPVVPRYEPRLRLVLDARGESERDLGEASRARATSSCASLSCARSSVSTALPASMRSSKLASLRLHSASRSLLAARAAASSSRRAASTHMRAASSSRISATVRSLSASSLLTLCSFSLTSAKVALTGASAGSDSALSCATSLAIALSATRQPLASHAPASLGSTRPSESLESLVIGASGGSTAPLSDCRGFGAEPALGRVTGLASISGVDARRSAGPVSTEGRALLAAAACSFSSHSFVSMPASPVCAPMPRCGKPRNVRPIAIMRKPGQGPKPLGAEAPSKSSSSMTASSSGSTPRQIEYAESEK